jgi:arylsulfatase A-like enzyme
MVWLAFNAAHKPWDLPPEDAYTPVDGWDGAAKSQQYVLEAADTLLGQLRSAYADAWPAAAARTLWIVIGDNGTPPGAVEPPWPAHQHKDTVNEGGVHVPLIVAGAGVATPGATCDALVHAVDLWATVQEVLRVPLPGLRTDSVSFAPALADPAAFAGRGWVYVRLHEPNGYGRYDVRKHAARDERWKLAVHSNGTVKLFDLAADPLEQTNLWPPSTPEQQHAADALQAILDANDAPSP